MSLTALDLLNEVRHASNSDQASEYQTQISIVNQALSCVNRMHPWDGMIRGPVDLAAVSGQNFVDLPADCREAIVIQTNSGNTSWLTWTDLKTIASFRTRELSPSPAIGGYYGAMARRDGPTGPINVVEIYPKAAATQADYFQLTYRKRIMPINKGTATDSTYMQTPDYMEDLIRRVVRAYAVGIEDEDMGEVENRLQAIYDSEWLESIKTEDAALQPEMGEMRNGAAEMADWDQDSMWNWTGNIEDPS